MGLIRDEAVATPPLDVGDLAGRRLVIVTDAWYPQINGVVRTLDTTRVELTKLGLDVHVIGPDRFASVPCPTYPEIRLAMSAPWRLPAMLADLVPAGIHIATEGPLGIVARQYCKRNGITFTTSFHTRFPEYIEARTKLPPALMYAWLRRFHNDAASTMVTTPSMKADLTARGFTNLNIWSRGVDLDLFRPRETTILNALPRPIFMNVGRVAVEKNLEAFLDLDLPGSKVVVGGGPQLEAMRAAYPSVHFTGPKTGDELAQHYAAADVFVFPSKTDTFGLVILEAMASGAPVAAHAVPGPVDILAGTDAGVLSHDLRDAALRALDIPPQVARAHAERYSWAACTKQFLTLALPTLYQFDNPVAPAVAA